MKPLTRNQLRLLKHNKRIVWQKFSKTFKGKRLSFVIVTYWIDEETWEKGKQPNRISGKKAIFDECIKEIGKNPEDILAIGDLKSPEEINDFLYGFLDMGMVYTEEEYKKVQEEEQRARLENLEADFARKNKVQSGSLDFIRALESCLNKESDYRYGLQEDGLCATSNPFSSSGVNEWFDLHNSSSSRTSILYEIMDYLETQCPLLMAKYRETQLQESLCKPQSI